MTDYTMMWLAIMIVLIGIEIVTVGLTTIWFAIGALVAILVAVLGGGFILQVAVFLVVSLGMLIFTRPFAMKYINTTHFKTNYEGIIGKIVRITQDVDNISATGAAVVNGQEWTVRSTQDDILIPAGSLAKVVSISGVKLIVEKYEEEKVQLLFVVIIILASNVRIVPQASAYVIERLGGYSTTWGVGLHFKIPFLDRVAKRVNLKEQVVDFPPQPVITKDNVTMQIDTVVFFQITDPKMYAYGVDNPIVAIEKLTATTLRNIIGDMELDQTLTSREVINTSMRSALDVATDPWGIKVNRVELKNIIPPEAIRNAMEKQMKAERERREAVTIAEGEKKSSILVAEGKKESAILEAEAEKQAAILRAEAEKEKRIKEAEGQAEAVRIVQQANAEGIRYLKEAGADQAVLTIKSLEAFEKAANGQATKIIIPSEIQGVAGLAKSLGEVLK